VTIDWDPDDRDGDAENQFRSALSAGRFGDARTLIDERVSDANAPQWLVTSMLEDLGLSLAHAGHHDDAIAAFERALDLGWNVVPDGRCEIARVLLLAGRSAEADVLWRRLRDADPDGVWTLNAGGLAYGEVGRDEQAVEWLAAGLHVAIGRDDPEHVVDQMSDARRVSLRRLGRELDELERDVEAFRARAAAREHERLSELRTTTKQAGIPMRGRPATIAWLTEADITATRERWPTWVDGLDHDEPYGERRARMERRLREHRADGDGPFVIVTIDLDGYAAWCGERGYEPADRRSRGSFVEHVRDQGGGRSWPPGRNEPCWCGSERKYKRCCGALSTHAAARSVA
jgi:Flp pilus assembly protein TadD